MKKGFLFITLIGCMLFVSCKKKYNCTCETDVYDSQGYYITTHYETQTVRARPITASMECSNLSNYSTGKYCSLN